MSHCMINRSTTTRFRISRLFVFVTCLLLFALVRNGQSGDSNSKSIKVLIVDGFSNHNWQQTTHVVQQILEIAGLFTVDVSTTPSSPNDPEWDTWRPPFDRYDVVIQNTNNIGKKEFRWPSEVEVALENYVKSGGGLYILHSANNAFSHWDEYDHMIGLGWRGKDAGTALEVDENGRIIRIPPGEGKGTSHGPRQDTIVRKLNNHPINEGYPGRWKTPLLEVYTYARGPAQNLTVLSYAYDETTEKYWPIEWIVRYGKGRVYNSTFGHLWRGEVEPAGVRCVGFQTTLIRATEWLATEKVTWPIPSDFPTEDTQRLRQILTKDAFSYLPESAQHVSVPVIKVAPTYRIDPNQFAILKPIEPIKAIEVKPVRRIDPNSFAFAKRIQAVKASPAYRIDPNQFTILKPIEPFKVIEVKPVQRIDPNLLRIAEPIKAIPVYRIDPNQFALLKPIDPIKPIELRPIHRIDPNSFVFAEPMRAIKAMSTYRVDPNQFTIFQPIAPIKAIEFKPVQRIDPNRYGLAKPLKAIEASRVYRIDPNQLTFQRSINPNNIWRIGKPIESDKQKQQKKKTSKP